MFTQTVGDPGRSERIAAAVLDDDAARAEVAAPITDTVMRRTGLPPEQRPLVAGQVDRVLQDPRGAQAFIDPFAGSWARMLGEDDPRPTQFDLAPLLTDFQSIADAAAAADGAPAFTVPDTLPVGAVPLPRAELGWMRGVRRGVEVAMIPLAMVAAALFAMAYLSGDRGRVLRRFGAWAVSAGGLWAILPPLGVWAARRWAPGADSVVAAALDEATDGLVPVALVLVLAGVAAYAGSYAIPAREAVASPLDRVPPAVPRRRAIKPVHITQEIPITPPSIPATPRPAPPTRLTDTPPRRPDDPDDVWDYYSNA